MNIENGNAFLGKIIDELNAEPLYKRLGYRISPVPKIPLTTHPLMVCRDRAMWHATVQNDVLVWAMERGYWEQALEANDIMTMYIEQALKFDERLRRAI